MLNIMRRYTLFVFSLLLAIAVFTGCSRGNTDGLAVTADVSSQENQISQDQQLPESESQVTNWAGSLEAGFMDGESYGASFLKPYGLCEAPGGGLLVVDCYANQLRVATEERVASLAGSTMDLNESGLPVGGYLNGDGGEALLSRPRFAAVSPEGTIIFSDTENHCIRALKDGIVRLVAGNRSPGFQDGDYGDAEFNMPSGVAIGTGGVIYVADTLNHCIREISPEGQVRVLAGTPGKAGLRDGEPNTALFCEPNDIQLGADGALYVVDKGNQRIRRVTTEAVTTVAGSGGDTDPSTGYMIGGYQDGVAASAEFLYPTGLYVAENGDIYVADTGNHCIRLISPEGIVSTVAGSKMPGNENGPAKDARFNQPLDVLYKDGYLYISDSYNHIIRAVDLGAEKGEIAP